MSKKIAKIVVLAMMSAGIFLSFQTRASAACDLCGGSGTFIACYDCGCAMQQGGTCLKSFTDFNCYCVVM